ncbi:MAG TPA: fibronectin type III domain-containing protein, partial [Solirubrobacteraceae bacterium]|nr:fibronectin type III domain-containing protein [Solirubrobacteraceae bacterium]
MNGTLNPNGLDTHYYFQYGQTTEYGLSTSPVDAGSGTGVLAENVTITGLLSGTSYHYRIVASSVAGTSYGKDETLTTKILSTPSVLQQSNGDQEVYYRSTNGILNWWFWNTSNGTWTQEWLGSEENMMAGNP